MVTYSAVTPVPGDLMLSFGLLKHQASKCAQTYMQANTPYTEIERVIDDEIEVLGGTW